MRMKSRSVVLFSVKELQRLVTVSASCVHVERRIRHIAMLPNCLRDLKSAVNGIFNSYQNKFDVDFNGFILGYKNVKIITDRATIINDDCYMHLDIEAEFYIFTPEIGCTLFGIVNKKSVDHIGCLVHKCFHVSIPQSTEETDEWLGTSVRIGDQVTFRVEMCDFTGSLPYIRGKLIDSRPANVTSLEEDEVDRISEPKRKKKKNKKNKHKESDLSEHDECELMAENLEQGKIEPVVETQQKKRKRHLEDEGEAATEKKKKKKLEGYKSVYHETPESEELHFTHLSSEDVEYGTILEDLKETYLKEPEGDIDSEAYKKKKKKKQKLHSVTSDGKETATELTEVLEHTYEGNGDEVVHFPDHAKKKKNKHKESDLSEHEECELLAENLEQGKIEPVVETQQKKRKRHLEDEGEAATEKKKKKKLEGYTSVYHETPESEELHFTHLSSEDIEYGTILEDLKETYLKEPEGDIDSEAYKKKKKKKHKLHSVTNDGKETATELTEVFEHAYEGNGDEVVHFPDHAKKKKKQGENIVGEIPGLMTDVAYEAVAKQLEESFTLPSFSTQDNLHTSSSGSVCTSGIDAFPGTNRQKTNFNVNDFHPKAKKKKVKKHDSCTSESLDQNKAKESDASQKYLLGNDLESSSDNRHQNYKEKKKQRKARDSDNKESLNVLSETDEFTLIKELLAGNEKSVVKHGLNSHTQSRAEEHVESVLSNKELVKRAESFIPVSSSGPDDLYVSNTSSVLTSSITEFPVAHHQEADFYRKDVGLKTKKKRIAVCDSHNKELLDDQTKSLKSVSKEESLVGVEKSVGEQSLGSLPGNGDEKQDMSVPSVVDLLNRVKSMLNVKSSKKHKKEKGNKKHSGISDEPKTFSKPPCGVDYSNGTKQDHLKLDKNANNEKSTLKDSSKTHSGVTDGLDSNEIQNKIKVSENKGVESINATTLLKNVLGYSNGHSDSHDGTKSDEHGSHVSAVLHEVEKEPDNVNVSSHRNKKKHKTKKCKNKASVSFDPAAMLAEYMSKFDHSEGVERDSHSDACQSSMEDAVDTENKKAIGNTTSNTSFRSSFSITGAGMANAQDRKRKKMNRGKGDAMPLQRSLPVLSLSHSYQEADRSVGQEIVRSGSIESLNEFPKSSSPVTALPRKSDSGKKVRKAVTIYENGVLLTPEKDLTENKVATSLHSGSSNPAENVVNPEEITGSNFSLSSPKEVASPGKTPSKSMSQRIASDVSLYTLSPSSSKASERKDLKQQSAVNSPETKNKTVQVLSGVTHILKTPTSDKGHGSGSEGELINTSVILPEHSRVLQSLKSPAGDSEIPAWMPKVSPVKAKMMNENSTNSLQETMSPEIKSKHKTKKKHKEKKSKIKSNEGKEQKEKNVKDCKDDRETRNENNLETQKNVAAMKDKHDAERTKRKDFEGKAEKSKEKDTEDTLEDLKTLASKLFSSFLQQKK